MMKKYTKPEIETLALETVDVIAASAATLATYTALDTKIAASATGTSYNAAPDVQEFTQTWSW